MGWSNQQAENDYSGENGVGSEQVRDLGERENYVMFDVANQRLW